MDGASGSDGAMLYYVFDGLVMLRALYGFIKSYFIAKLEKPREGESMGNQEPAPSTIEKKIRVYMDGCFDMMHFGHANALRQAKMLGDELVVGICSDAEILAHKGPPVMNEEERKIAVGAVKWVDEILEDAPYDLTPEFLQVLFDKHRIDYVIHGDDPCIGKDGQDVYASVKRAGKFRSIKRTEGVSSTDIVGRMLLCTRSHHLEAVSNADQVPQENGGTLPSAHGEARVSTFLPTTRRLIQFASGGRAPKPTDKVVYVDGTFDMFHCGHILTLQAARQAGDFVLVGIHDDTTVNQHKGKNFPIMNLHERTLSVLSCKYVDEVIIGAPWEVTEDMIKTMNISLVLHGTMGDNDLPDSERDAYEYPKSIGIYREVQSRSDLTIEEIINRIVTHREKYEQRNKHKVAQEQKYLDQKEYIQEL